MDILIIVFALLLMVCGVAGCILPVLPGAPLAYAGLLLLHFTELTHFTTSELVIWLIIVIVLQIVDYIIPLLGNKYSGYTIRIVFYALGDYHRSFCRSYSW